MNTPFSRILRAAVERIPGAIGGAFAASDGETVDAWAAEQSRDEWAIFTAHYGIVLQQVQSWLHTRHYGSAELVLLSHERLDVLVRDVAEGYYALLAVARPNPLALAILELERAATALAEEMA